MTTEAVDDVMVTATLITPEGEAVKQQSGSLSLLPRTAPFSIARLAATVELSLADVTPGRYLMTLVAESPAPTRRVMRQIPVVVED